MARAYLGVGSNQGDRLALISQAVKAVGAQPGIAVQTIAPIIETAPVGGPPQGPYLNTVVAIDTAHAPEALLALLHTIERSLGRKRSSERWGPRPIDLDILLYDGLMIDTPALTIPHPRLHERRFVLEPLAQLAPGLTHPRLKRSIAELLAALPPAGEPGTPGDDPWP